ncbi:MAG: chorismate synthase [Christensenella sp.]|nr:chorismate synthase [Christensenella sp.]
MLSSLDNLKIEINGASHAESIDVTVWGIPQGIKIDLDELQEYVDRRKARKTIYSTKRLEEDKINVLSGIENGVTTGDAIKCVVYNLDPHSNDYTKLQDTPRPSHADYVAKVKYNGKEDMRGGGRFSGRMTLTICILGGIAKQILKNHNIQVEGYVQSIAGINSTSYKDRDIKAEEIQALDNSFRVIDLDKKELMLEKIQQAAANKDSVGGVVEAIAYNLPVGLGGPLFESMEGKISYAMFAVPAVKGIEFGSGFDISKMTGSTANDCFYYDENKNVKTYTNNNGGINGGITNGMPLTIRVALKPTPSIAQEQKTIDMATKTNTTIQIKGRHDSCIVPRAVVCVESVLALCILDSIIKQ